MAVETSKEVSKEAFIRSKLSVKPLRDTKPRLQPLWLLFLLPLALWGCASKQLASAEDDAQAKTFSPPADRAYVYVVRYASMVGSAVDVTVNLNDKLAADIQNKTYALLDVPVGKHVLKMGILRPNPTPTETFFVPAQFDLDAQPGRVYFVSVRLRNGGPEVRLLGDAEGRQLLLEKNYRRVLTVF